VDPARVPTQLILFDLDEPGAADADQFALLNETEKIRANRFVFERDRRRFIAGRCQLRRQLGAALSIAPMEIEFGFGPYGKPHLNPSQNPFDIQFNLSHTDRWGLLVIAQTQRLGIDIELGKSLNDAQNLFAHCLCDRELDQIRLLDEAAQLDQFFSIWARKEAALKAHGLGFTVAPKTFDALVGQCNDQINIPGYEPVFLTDLSDHLPKSVQCKAAIASTSKITMPSIQLIHSHQVPA
jgi:4'-phosphopantetheinyl transferase